VALIFLNTSNMEKEYIDSQRGSLNEKNVKTYSLGALILFVLRFQN